MQTDRNEIYKSILQREILASLSKNQLAAIITACSRERKERYLRKKRKRGNINKGFAKEQLRLFFAVPMSPKARLAFLTMLSAGLRVGEAVAIKAEHIDRLLHRLSIRTEKANTNDSAFLCDTIYALLLDWIEEHSDEIAAHNGYVFFSSQQGRDHISNNWLRKEFRRVCIAADIDRTYDTTTERTGRRTRRLHILSTHSFRHTFGTGLYRQTKDLLLTSRGLRHTSMNSTNAYVHADMTDVDQAIASYAREL